MNNLRDQGLNTVTTSYFIISFIDQQQPKKAIYSNIPSIYIFL